MKMKHHILILSLFALHSSLFALSAAVPLRWTVETSRAVPATFEAYQGETLDLEACLQSYGKPLEAPVEYALYWQTNGMGNAWWTAPCASASSPTNVMRATWRPAYDVGARAYSCFIGATGTIYHAAFQLRLRPSPGAHPNELPLPQKVIDFAQVTVLNPPWEGIGITAGEVTNIAQAVVAPATNRLDGALADEIAAATNAVPRIVSGLNEIRADLTATVHADVRTDRWEPDGNPVPDNPDPGFVKYYGIYWEDYSQEWMCMAEEWDGEEWWEQGDAPIGGDYDDETLTLPDGTVAHRVHETVAVPTKLATTNDLESVRGEINSATNRLVGALADEIAAATNAVPRIVSGGHELHADLTVRETITYADWTPYQSPIPADPQEGDIYYYNPEWIDGDGEWINSLMMYVDGEWVYDGEGLMEGPHAHDPNATELEFPDGTKTYRKRTLVTKAATTNDLAALRRDVDAIRLDGAVFDFSDNKAIYSALSNIIINLGGSVTNFPSFQQ